MFSPHRAGEAVIKDIQTIRCPHTNLLGKEPARNFGILSRHAWVMARREPNPPTFPWSALDYRIYQIMRRLLESLGTQAEVGSLREAFLWVISRTPVRDLDH